MIPSRFGTHFALEKFLKPYHGLPLTKGQIQASNQASQDSFGSSLPQLVFTTFISPYLEKNYPFLVMIATVVDPRISWRILKSVTTFIDRHLMYTVTIQNTEYKLRDAIMGWAITTSAFLTGTNAHDATTTIYNAEGLAAPSHLQFMPSYGTRLFWYQGNLLLFIRTAEETGFGHIQIKCFGRQRSIIHHFLLHVLNHQRIASHTRTYYPKSESGKLYWKLTSSRRRRPMSTVIFDETEKEKLTKDVKEFFTMEDWYSYRSIPYRRGYLFHGPTGTGKTSLCYAIAGEIELDVYVLSLSNPDLGENTIISFLNLLPSRCLLLLEDIDAVGISRDLAQSQVKPGPKPISLSTLLNILDGSLAHCGSITCATTNFPNRLDAALLRIGRVDYQVAFTKANRAVVAGVFNLMFTFPKDDSHIDIEDLAKQFAAKIPEFMFTAAEVQGYVLNLS